MQVSIPDYLPLHLSCADLEVAKREAREHPREVRSLITVYGSGRWVTEAHRRLYPVTLVVMRAEHYIAERHSALDKIMHREHAVRFHERSVVLVLADLATGTLYGPQCGRCFTSDTLRLKKEQRR